MFKFNLCVYMAVLAIFMVVGGIAMGECVVDGNDSATDARLIGYDEAVTDVVCPDIDLFDYFFFEVPGGSHVSGTIILNSGQTGTTMKISHSSGDLFDAGTTDDTDVLQYSSLTTVMDPGTYYIRIGFYSTYDFDHEYILTVDLNDSSADPGTHTIPVEELHPGTGVATGTMLDSRVSGTYTIPSFEIPPSVPWPSHRCGATHRGRSDYNGPPGSAVKVAEFNVPDDLGLVAADYAFAGILAGNDDRIYCQGAVYMFAAYDVSSGLLWEYPVGPTWHPSCLDGDGNIYVINFYQTHLISLDPDGNELWSVEVPGGDHYLQLWAVGRRIYTPKCIALDDNRVYVWEKNGDPAWNTGPISESLIGMVEDPGTAAYFQGRDGMYQYNWAGEQTWYFEFEDAVVDTGALTILSPFVGHDHRIWVHEPWRKKVYIINPNGTLYAENDYTSSIADAPSAACFGLNRSLIVATKGGELVCYNDWTTESWRVSLPGPVGPNDLIMGQDNIIYIHYHTLPTLTALIFEHHWASINPDTGATIFDTVIEMPLEFTKKKRGELAIGEDGKLLYLNAKGYIVVYNPTLTPFAPGLILKEPLMRKELRQ